MEPNGKTSVHRFMRALHRDLGYFVAGLTVIYALSGIVLIYRDTDFLKRETVVEKKVSPGMGLSELAQALHQRDLEVTRTAGDTVCFRGGWYDPSNGNAAYTTRSYVFPLDRFVRLHNTSSKNPISWFAVAYGVLLLFLAISSFWMFRAGTSRFRRGVILAVIGIVIAVVLLIL